MSEKTNLHSPDNAKKLAKRISKATPLSHSEALELIAKELGYTSWHHYLKECGEKPRPQQEGIEHHRIELDVPYDQAFPTGLHEVKGWEDAYSHRFSVIVDSRTRYAIDENADRIIDWLKKYSENVDYRFVLEGLGIDRGFPAFGSSLDFFLTTTDLAEAKAFGEAFFTFLNSLSR
jgi:hypothetical protein